MHIYCNAFLTLYCFALLSDRILFSFAHHCQHCIHVQQGVNGALGALCLAMSILWGREGAVLPQQEGMHSSLNNACTELGRCMVQKTWRRTQLLFLPEETRCKITNANALPCFCISQTEAHTLIAALISCHLHAVLWCAGRQHGASCSQHQTSPHPDPPGHHQAQLCCPPQRCAMQGGCEEAEALPSKPASVRAGIAAPLQ